MHIILNFIILLLLSSPAYAGQLWTKSATAVLKPTVSWEDTVDGEPSVIKLGTNSWRIFYTGYNNSTTHEGIGTATSTDGIIWTKNASNPIIGRGAGGEAGDIARDYAYTEGGIIYLFYAADSAGLRDIWMQSSADNGATFGNRVEVLDHANAPAGYIGFHNTGFVKVGSTYHMFIECQKSSGTDLFHMFHGTASNIAGPYTLDSTPMDDLIVSPGGVAGGPMPWYNTANSTCYMWYHASTAGAALPTQIYFSSSTDFVHWTTPVLVIPIANEQDLGAFPGGVLDQTGDVFALQDGNQSYLYYVRGVNTPTIIGNISRATFNGSFTALIDQMNTKSIGQNVTLKNVTLN